MGRPKKQKEEPVCDRKIDWGNCVKILLDLVEPLPDGPRYIVKIGLSYLDLPCFDPNGDSAKELNKRNDYLGLLQISNVTKLKELVNNGIVNLKSIKVAVPTPHSNDNKTELAIIRDETISLECLCKNSEIVHNDRGISMGTNLLYCGSCADAKNNSCIAQQYITAIEAFAKRIGDCNTCPYANSNNCYSEKYRSFVEEKEKKAKAEIDSGSKECSSGQ
jgi:hypothetical protein